MHTCHEAEVVDAVLAGAGALVPDGAGAGAGAGALGVSVAVLAAGAVGGEAGSAVGVLLAVGAVTGAGVGEAVLLLVCVVAGAGAGFVGAAAAGADAACVLTVPSGFPTITERIAVDTFPAASVAL